MAGALHAALSGLAAIVYFMIALWVLRTGHLHEDAYILFTYVENLARGKGIVYYAGGPPAEGATDFLWLMILGALRWAGVDAGLAAAALNAVGIGIICWLSLRALPQGLELASRVLVGLCIAFVLVLSPISSAAAMSCRC